MFHPHLPQNPPLEATFEAYALEGLAEQFGLKLELEAPQNHQHHHPPGFRYFWMSELSTDSWQTQRCMFGKKTWFCWSNGWNVGSTHQKEVKTSILERLKALVFP